MSSFFLALATLCPFVLSNAEPVRHSFRGPAAAMQHNVTIKELEAGLQASFQSLLNYDSFATMRRLEEMEASVASTFQAVPKNEMGRVSARALRHIIYNYFVKEHGWQITGLEVHGLQDQVSDVSDISILQVKAPALVEQLLETRRSNHGLSLNDIVAMIATLENLIVDESLETLSYAYDVNNATESDLNHSDMDAVLTSYLLLHEVRGYLGSDELTSHQNHEEMKLTMKTINQTWSDILIFEHDALQNYDYERRSFINPFRHHTYDLKVATEVTELLTKGYGKWQNQECQAMKEELLTMSSGNGRVPISKFYATDEAEHSFTESFKYLRAIGALEEPAGLEPRLRIANYMNGPSNCIVTSSYYSVCCISECFSLMNEIEDKVKGPLATPAQLMAMVKDMSSPTVDAPRELSADLIKRLKQIASRHDGAVPIHGRLFAQWMHGAFPNECPFPHLATDAAIFKNAAWEDSTYSKVTEEEMRSISKYSSSTASASAPDAFDWSDEELLPLLEPKKSSRMLSFMRIITFIAVCAVMFRIFCAASKAARQSFSAGAYGLAKKRDAESLPL